MRAVREHVAAFSLALLLGAVASACSSTEHGEDDAHANSATCPGAERVDAWSLPLTKSAGPVTVALESALPSPLGKGKNTLVLSVRDAAGAPLDGASVTVTPFMPDHGHGSTVTPTVRAMGGVRYEVGEVVLPMAGVWELAVAVTPPGAAEARVTFVACIAS